MWIYTKINGDLHWWTQIFHTWSLFKQKKKTARVPTHNNTFKPRCLALILLLVVRTDVTCIEHISMMAIRWVVRVFLENKCEILIIIYVFLDSTITHFCPCHVYYCKTLNCPRICELGAYWLQTRGSIDNRVMACNVRVYSTNKQLYLVFVEVGSFIDYIGLL